MSRVQAAAGIAICLSAMALPVQAEEVFLCEDGRLVYASMETIEGLKRTDPCVARYFGLEAVAQPVTPPVSKPALRGSADVPDAGAAPSQDGPQSRSRLRGGDRHAARADKPVRAATPPAAPAKAAGSPGHGTAISAATQAVSSNNGYREVHIINASDGDGAVYRHER